LGFHHVRAQTAIDSFWESFVWTTARAMCA
jgi:hypothetical protein